MPHTEIMNEELQPYLTVRIAPDDMVRYVQQLMTSPQGAPPEADGETPVVRAARLRWRALNRAFGDQRVSTWTSGRREQIHVPAALIGAAGVARLTVAEDEVVFDIPELLDATLALCEPAGRA